VGERMVNIFVDGKYVGGTDRPDDFVRNVRNNRRAGELSGQINVAYHSHLNEIEVMSDSGRVRRPLIVVEDGNRSVEKRRYRI
jgi:DNA-directed RNA polymerase subunit B'